MPLTPEQERALTPPLRRLYAALVADERASYRDLMAATGARSTSVISAHLDKLAALGLVRLTPRQARRIEVIKCDV